jgi:hypothetical protein
MPPLRKRKYHNDLFMGTNWCGGRFSNGKRQRNTSGNAPATNRFDQACKDHDINLASGMDTETADLIFAGEVDNPLVGYAPYVYHKGMSLLENNNKMQTPQKSQLIEMESSAGSVSYATTGGGGGGQVATFGKGKKVSKGATQNGITLEYEIGFKETEAATASAPVSQCLYVGHCTSDRTSQSLAIWCAIIKKLAQKCGYDVPSLETGLFSNAGAVAPGLYFHVVLESTTLGQSTIDTNVNQTIYDNANQIVSFIFTTLNTVAQPRLIFKEIVLRQGTTASFNELGNLTLERMLIHLTTSSEITMQNTTLTASGGTDIDQNTVNPLQMTKFYCKQPNFSVVGFTDVESDLQDGSNLGKARPDTITNGGANIKYIRFYNQQPANIRSKIFLRNPPNPDEVEGCYRIAKGILSPSGIIKDYLTKKSTFYLKTFYGGNLSESAENNTLEEYGVSTTICFQKVMDTRTDLIAPQISGQLRQRFHVEIGKGRPPPTQVFKQIEFKTY